MGNLVIATDSWSGPASVAALTEAAERPASNLQLVQPRVRYQSVGNGPHRLSYQLQRARGANFAAPLFHNGTEQATFRVRFASNVISVGLAPVYDSAGGFGSELSFDGLDARVWVGGSAALDVGTFTIEAWIKPQVLRRQGILARAGGTISAVLSMTLDGRIRFVGLPGLIGNIVSPLPVPVREYTHIAGTYNASTQVMALLINGEVVASQPGVVAVFDGPSLEIASVESSRFWGRLDDVRFWNVARTPAEIAGAYLTELASIPGSCVGYWKLNEATGTTTADESASGNVGALENLALWVYPQPLRVPWAVADSDGMLPGADLDPFLGNHHGLWWNQAGVSAAHCRIDILDPNNPDGFLRIGRMMIGAGWQLALNEQYGSDLFGMEDDSPSENLPSGPTITMGIPPRPVKRFSVRSTNEREMLENAHAIAMLNGSSKPLLVISDPDETAFLQQKIYYGRLQPQQAAVNSQWSLYEQPFTVTGML